MPTVVKLPALAKHLDLEPTSLKDLLASGALPREELQTGRGDYDLDKSRVYYIRRLRARAIGRPSSTDGGGETQASTKIELTKQQAERYRIENDRSKGKLVEIEAVGQFVERQYATLRASLLAMPGKLAAKLVGLKRGQINAAITDEINEALAELHAPSSIADLNGHGGAGEETSAGASGAEAQSENDDD